MNNLEQNVYGIQMSIFFDISKSFSVLSLANEIYKEFKVMFPTEPQIVQLPPGSPANIPRCFFVKDNGSASLTISLERMDFKGTIKNGSLWRQNIGVLLYALLSICKVMDISVIRIGAVVETKTEINPSEMLKEFIDIDDFINAQEKSIMWVKKDTIEDIIYNKCTNIQVNINNPIQQNSITFDANTDTSSVLDYEKLISISNNLLDILEEKMKNVI